jgi:hypothetical protein
METEDRQPLVGIHRGLGSMHQGGDQMKSCRDPSSCERCDMVRGETKWCDGSVYNQPDLRSATTHVF